jgi:hypothetical protein
MNQFFTEIVLYVVVILVVLLAAFSWRWIKNYLRLKLGEKTYDLLADKAEMIVRSIEQTGFYAKWDGAYKKQLAMVALRKFADLLKLDVTDDVLDEVIEAMVQLLNTEAGKFETPQLLEETTGQLVTPPVGQD